jgi:hypothetical protein
MEGVVVCVSWGERERGCQAIIWDKCMTRMELQQTTCRRVEGWAHRSIG